MKKVVFLVLALVLTFAMTMTCFADYVDYKVTFDHSSGLIGQSFNDDAIGNGTPWIEPDDTTTVNNIRINWTATRAIRDAGTVAEYVNIGTEAAPNIAVEIKGNEAMVNDYNAHTLGEDKFYFTIDLQAKKIGTFCGATFNATNAGIGSGSDALPTEGGKYLQNTGFGFTLTGSNKVLLFVAGTAEANFDAQEMTLPFDATSAMHTYSMEVDFAAKKAEFYADNQLIGVFQAYGDDLFGIFNADGTPSADANDTNDGFNVAPGGTESNPDGANDGNVMFAVAGSDSDVIIDNVYYGFAFPSHDAPSGDEPKTEAPAEAAPAYDSSLVYNCTTGNNIGVWLQTTDTESLATVFNVDKPFNEIKFDIFWASNPPTNNGSKNYNFKVDIYKFSYNYENSVAGTPVASGALLDIAGDNYNTVPSFSVEGTNLVMRGANNGLQAVLLSDLPAGQYVMVITNDAGEGSYLVLPTAEGDLADCKYYRGTAEGEPIRFALNTAGQFVDLIPDSDVPAPQTGDTTVAMFAVIAVVALAAVVVFKKRVNA